MARHVAWFQDIRLKALPLVGGKTASLGELYSELAAAGVRVPNGFAVTGAAYTALLDGAGLRPQLTALLGNVTGDDLTALAEAAGYGELDNSAIVRAYCSRPR